MHYRLIRGSLAALLAGGLTAGLALAQVRQPGSSIAYDVKAMGQGDTKLAIKISGVDADGTAHVTMTFAPPRVPQGSVPTLNGTITPAGAILPQFSAVTGTPHMGMSSAEAAAMSQSMIGQMLQFTLQPFNAFATAAGSRPELKVGESWNAAADGPMVPALAFVVTGREQHLGHDTFVITFQSAPGAALPLSGQGYYDASAHSVVEAAYKQQTPDGQQSSDTDIALTP
jgi:hypothetical protein